MVLKMQYCFNCGAECGVFEHFYHRDLVTCGKGECEREAREQARYDDDMARERAAEDGYDRYR